MAVEFKSGKELTEAIQTVASGANLDMAVAFWGKGACQFLRLGKRKDWRILCNLAMGGTHPEAIREFENPGLTGKPTAKIKEHLLLHSKVYVSDTGLVVCSANVSNNGCGFEGRLSKWTEAGAYFSGEDQAVSQARIWFERLWNDRRNSVAISDSRLTSVLPLYRKRQSSAIGLGRLDLIDMSEDAFPLISWWEDDEDFEIPSKFGADARTAIEKGHALREDADWEALQPGRWILWWEMKGDRPNEATLCWLRLGTMEKACGKWDSDDEFGDGMLADLSPGPPPIKLTRNFRSSFWKKLSEPAFRQLRTVNYKGDYYSPGRLKLMQRFWREIQQETAK